MDATATEPTRPHAAFDALDRALAADGPEAALDRLIAELEEQGPPRALLDALVLKARYDLGLPAFQDGTLADLPEPLRSRFEDRYVAAIRRVGTKLLDAGDLVAAWPYFRAIAEREPIVAALDACQPEPGDERVGALIDVAFNQGAHPRRGFELILEHYGTCSAITAFEHLPPDLDVRTACAGRLIRTLHDQLAASLRAEIARRGQVVPPEGAPIGALVSGRDWLFVDDAYHIDVSHLAAVVRLAPLATDPEVLRLALGLTDYGRRLSERHRYEGEPPFERTYEDHAVYIRALLGEDVDAGIDHFAARLGPPDPDGDPAESLPAQHLVRLLERTGRIDRAIDVAAEHLADVPEAQLFCTPLAALCQRAGQLDRLAEHARARGDLVHYLAARLRTADRPG